MYWDIVEVVRAIVNIRFGRGDLKVFWEVECWGMEGCGVERPELSSFRKLGFRI